MVNQNLHFEAKVVFIRPNELHETPELMELFSPNSLQNFLEATMENCGIFPVVIDNNGKVLVGNARLFVAKALNLDLIPTIRQELLTPEEIDGFSKVAMQFGGACRLGANFIIAELKELKAIGLKGKFLVQNGEEEDGFTKI